MNTRWTFGRGAGRARRGAPLIAVGAALVLAVAACGSSSSGGSGASEGTSAGPNAGQSVAIVGYSVPKPAYDALETSFKQTDAGKGVKFSETFGASGTESK